MYNEYYAALNDYRNYLEHFGVKGMKWGVRKTPQRTGNGTGAKRKAITSDEKKAKRAKAMKTAGKIAAGAALTALAVGGVAYLSSKKVKPYVNAGLPAVQNMRRNGSFQRTISTTAVGFVNPPKTTRASDAVPGYKYVGGGMYSPNHGSGSTSSIKNQWEQRQKYRR